MKSFVIFVLCIIVCATALTITVVNEDSNGGDTFITDGHHHQQTTAVIEDPIVCNPDKKPDPNGSCTDVFPNQINNVIPNPIIRPTVMKPGEIRKSREICPPNYRADENGKCREIF